MRPVFLHGLESGPHGSKYHRLASRWPQLMAPDCEGVYDLWQRLERVEQALKEIAEPLVLVGSSFGGLVACHFAERFPDRVAGLVLCAPALHVPGEWMPGSSPSEVIIIHGVADEIVPIEASRVWAERFGLKLIEVQDGHRLSDSHGLMVDAVAGMIDRKSNQEGA